MQAFAKVGLTWNLCTHPFGNENNVGYYYRKIFGEPVSTQIVACFPLLCIGENAKREVTAVGKSRNYISSRIQKLGLSQSMQQKAKKPDTGQSNVTEGRICNSLKFLP